MEGFCLENMKIKSYLFSRYIEWLQLKSTPETCIGKPKRDMLMHHGLCVDS